jgi:phosphoribosylamine--glycine ligase
MAADGTPFSGTLYAGLMWTDSGPKVLEFNVRFGDPETQALMPLLIESDVCELLRSAAAGHLPAGLVTAARSAAAIVVASKGYPDDVQTGAEIRGLESTDDENTMVFHAGTRVVDKRVVTAGGRVLGVTGWASTLAEAIQRAYRATEQIHIDGAFFRRDIGRKHV